MASIITKVNTMLNRFVIHHDSSVHEAVEILKRGGVIALPTDTVYGLAAHAQNSNAINRLYEIKHREPDKPIAISIAEVKSIRVWAETNHLPNGLLDELLPGAVTVVLPRKSVLNPLLNPKYKEVGIRVPGSSFIQRVSMELGDALALTSANISTEPSPLNIDEFRNLWPQLGGVFDGGSLKGGRSGSTVVDLSDPGKFTIIRNGSALESTLSTLYRFELQKHSK